MQYHKRDNIVVYMVLVLSNVLLETNKPHMFSDKAFYSVMWLAGNKFTDESNYYDLATL